MQLEEKQKFMMMEQSLILVSIEYDPEINKDFENSLDIYSFNKIEDIPLFYKKP